MTVLHTSSYGRWRPGMGQPVVCSLTLPRWIPAAAQWPRCPAITPRWSYFRQDPGGAAYLAQLRAYGPQRIAKELEAIARAYEAERLCLLCFEADWAGCHRGRFASWWLETTGELVTDL